MQAIFETIFDIVYLLSVISLGIIMIRKSKGREEIRLLGLMAVVLGLGDAFHLVPRAYALCTNGLENHVVALGVGKLITSITMTVFYFILYKIWCLRYDVDMEKTGLTKTIYSLVLLRVVLCLLPQNQWTSATPSLTFDILRNIPFAILGIVIIVIFYKKSREHNDHAFKNMWLAIVLSFAFYIPVVLFSGVFPPIGALMIPKTCAYVWIVWMGYKDMKNKELA